MSVGVAQNAVDGNRWIVSEPGSQGGAFTAATSRRPDAGSHRMQLGRAMATAPSR